LFYNIILYKNTKKIVFKNTVKEITREFLKHTKDRLNREKKSQNTLSTYRKEEKMNPK
jgi:hypothetical protein